MSPLMSPLTSLLMSTSHHTLRTPSPRLSPQEALARALSLSSLSLERGLDQRLLWALTHPLTLKTALSEGLAGWLAHTLERERRLRPSSLPVSQRALDALNQASLQVMWADEVRREALCALWHRELPAPLLMKGASYGPRFGSSAPIWGEGERSSSDLDLLLPPLTHPQLTLLEQLTPLSQPALKRARFTGVYPLLLKDLLVEVHLSIAPPDRWPQVGPLSAERVWTEGREVWLDAHPHGLKARQPSEEARLAIALAQPLKSGLSLRLRDWVDLARLLTLSGGPRALAWAQQNSWREVGLSVTLELCLFGLSHTPLKALLPPELTAAPPSPLTDHALSYASPELRRFLFNPLKAPPLSRVARWHTRAIIQRLSR